MQIIAIDQLEANSGWQWANGKKTALLPQRVKEMQEAFSTGFMALRTDVLRRLQPGQPKVDPKSGLITLTVTLDGKPYAWIFDKQNRLGGEVSKADGAVTTTLSSNYRSVDGVWLPMKSITQAKGQSSTLMLGNAVVNGDIPAARWGVPK